MSLVFNSCLLGLLFPTGTGRGVKTRSRCREQAASSKQACKTTKNSAHTARGPRGLSSLCRPGSVPSYVNGFGGTLAVTSPVPYFFYFQWATPGSILIRFAPRSFSIPALVIRCRPNPLATTCANAQSEHMNTRQVTQICEEVRPHSLVCGHAHGGCRRSWSSSKICIDLTRLTRRAHAALLVLASSSAF